MYPGFAKVAREEGFEAIAMIWDDISVAERQHEKRYNDLRANIEAGRVFKREKSVRSGAAVIAAMYTRARMPPKRARRALIPRHISSCSGRIGNICNFAGPLSLRFRG